MTHAAFQILEADEINNIIAPGWTDYSGTFTLTASSVNPTKGSSSYAARYRRTAGGDHVFVQIKIAIGAGFAAGTGTWLFLLPFAAAAASAGGIGAVYILDAGTQHFNAVARLANTTQFECYRDGAAAGIGPSNPMVWAPGDIVEISLDYEPA